MTKTDKKVVFSGILLVVVLITLFLAGIRFLPSKEKGIEILTDRLEYNLDDVLKVKITNNSQKNYCFSSCYPYYFEHKKNGNWKAYVYESCPFPNLVEKCIGGNEVKAFKLNLSSLMKEGTHRLAIPFCLNCRPGDSFRSDKWFYSNAFNIK